MTATTEYGIWCDEDGGFAATQIYSVEEGEKEIAQMVDADADVASYTLTVIPVCPDHEEQPKDGCQECTDLEGDEY